MTRATKNEFPSHSFASRLSTMLQVDGRRLRHSTMFWVMLGCAMMIPILVLTMTTGFGGEGGAMFTNAWQIIGSDSAELGSMMSGMMGAMGGGTQAGAAAADPAAGAGMMSAMMNVNLVYFMAAIFICLFVAEDFQSGYAKNLFTVRARKTDYVTSKIIISWIAGALFLLAFFVGGVIGGKVADLPFTLGSAGVPGLVMCLMWSSSKKRLSTGSISSFSPFLEAAPGLVTMAPQRVMTAGSSTKQLSGNCSSAGSSVTSTPQARSASM